MMQPKLNRALLQLTTLALCFAAASCGDAPEAIAPAEPQTRTLVGVLHSDATAPHPVAEEARTGWIVVEEGTEMAIPVDLSAIIGQAQQLAGNRVAVDGVVADRTDDAGDKHFVFIARSIELAPAPAVEPDAEPR